MHVEAVPSTEKEWNGFTVLHQATYRKLVFLNYAVDISAYTRDQRTDRF